MQQKRARNPHIGGDMEWSSIRSRLRVRFTSIHGRGAASPWIRSLVSAAFILVSSLIYTGARAQSAVLVSFLGCSGNAWNYTEPSWYTVPWYFVTRLNSGGPDQMVQIDYVGASGRIDHRNAYLVSSFDWGDNPTSIRVPPAPPHQNIGQTLCAKSKHSRGTEARTVHVPV